MVRVCEIKDIECRNPECKGGCYYERTEINQEGMSHDEFHRLALRLANIASIRYWNYINYPHTPQEFAIFFAYEPSDQIKKELIDMGFKYSEQGDGIFRIKKRC